MTAQRIALDLSLGQVNLILEALGDQPYQRVFELVQQIHEQAAGQLEEPTGESLG